MSLLFAAAFHRELDFSRMRMGGIPVEGQSLHHTFSRARGTRTRNAGLLKGWGSVRPAFKFLAPSEYTAVPERVE
jgi:hypothetical protein